MISVIEVHRVDLHGMQGDRSTERCVDKFDWHVPLMAKSTKACDRAGGVAVLGWRPSPRFSPVRWNNVPEALLRAIGSCSVRATLSACAASAAPSSFYILERDRSRTEPVSRRDWRAIASAFQGRQAGRTVAQADSSGSRPTTMWIRQARRPVLRFSPSWRGGSDLSPRTPETQSARGGPIGKCRSSSARLKSRAHDKSCATI